MVFSTSLVALGILMMVIAALIVRSPKTHYIAAGVYFLIMGVAGFVVLALGGVGFLQSSLVTEETLIKIQLIGSGICFAPTALIILLLIYQLLAVRLVADYPRSGYLCKDCGYFWINTVNNGDAVNFRNGEKHYHSMWWCDECNSENLTECYIKRNFSWYNPFSWKNPWKFFQDYSGKKLLRVTAKG